MKKSTFIKLFTLLIILFIQIKAQQELIWINPSTQILNSQGYDCLKFFQIGTKYIFWQAKHYYFQNRANQVTNLVNSIKYNNHSNHLVWLYDHTQTVTSFLELYDKNFNSSIISILWLRPQYTVPTYIYGCDNLLTSMYQCFARNQLCGYYFNETTYNKYVNQSCPAISGQRLLFQGSSKQFKAFNGWDTYIYARDLNQSNLCLLNVGFSYPVSQKKWFQQKLRTQSIKQQANNQDVRKSIDFQKKYKDFQLKLQNIRIFAYPTLIVNQSRYLCFNAFKVGSKQIFWQISTANGPYDNYTKNIINSNKFTNHSNSIIYQYSPANVSLDFAKNIDTYFNQTIVDTIWLLPSTSNTTHNCDIARTAMYQCIKRSRKCGFYFNQDTYATLMKNQSCPQLSTFPLFYNGKKENFKSFNEWGSFKYAETNQTSNICQFANGYISNKIITGVQNQNINQNEIKQNYLKKKQQIGENVKIE